VFQKVEEGALARAAARQSSSALGRMEVANRKADQLLRQVSFAQNRGMLSEEGLMVEGSVPRRRCDMIN
jgi:hypothetical protein